MKMLVKHTLALRYFGLRKIPLILFVRPSIYRLTHEECIVGIPFRRRTKNHVKSLYIGALVVGADLAAGLLAMQSIKKGNHRISPIFKDMQTNFLKRVDANACFTCKEGEKIDRLVQKVIDTRERHHENIHIEVTAPDKYGDEVLATFSLTLSLKLKD